MPSKFVSLNLDFIGFSAALICAIHCMAVPIIVTFGAISGLSLLENHAIETFFIVTSVVLAGWSLLTAYRKKHKNPRALFI
ncbi:MAG: MerC domain-containing protein, partial [Bacteroidota bacterium]